MAITSNGAHQFVCKACHKHFTKEQSYLDHECTQMKRERELKTPTGQAAFNYYQSWMKQQKRVPPPASAFLGSQYFRTFMNFAGFSKKVNLPTPEKYIWLMIQKKFPPTMWMQDNVYALYMEFVDSKMSPLEQANISVRTILEYADKLDIKTSEVLDRVNPNDIIHLVRVRKLSPWLLLFSKKFATLFSTLSREQQSIMEALIKPDLWAEKLGDYPTEVLTIKTYVKELGL